MIRNILDAYEIGADILSGNIGDFHNAVSITPNIYWVDRIGCSSFFVIYSKFFKNISNTHFSVNNTVDEIISTMTINKMVLVLTIYTENMTDPLDVNYLGMQFRKIDKKYYGLESEFSKPLTLRFYMDINEDIDYEFLKGQIEKREMGIMLHGGKTRIEKVDFKLHSSSEKIDTISKREMLEHFFKSYKSIFNDSISKEKIMTYDIVYPEIEKPLIARQLPILANYLSLQDGILGLETILNDEDDPTIRIYFHKDKSSTDLIKNIISQPRWKIKNNDGLIKVVNTPFDFK